MKIDILHSLIVTDIFLKNKFINTSVFDYYDSLQQF